MEARHSEIGSIFETSATSDRFDSFNELTFLVSRYRNRCRKFRIKFKGESFDTEIQFPHPTTLFTIFSQILVRTIMLKTRTPLLYCLHFCAPDELTPESNSEAPICSTKLILKSVCGAWELLIFISNETQHETRIKCLTLFLTSCDRECCYFLVIQSHGV